jgi:hypothetical protein
MVAILALLFRTFLRPHLVREAKEQADKGITGRMEGHADGYVGAGRRFALAADCL